MRGKYLKWTPEMHDKLKELYPNYTNKKLVEFFSGSTPNSIFHQGQILGLEKKPTFRGQEVLKRIDAEEFKKDYPVLTDVKLAKKYSIGLNSIFALKELFGLKKNRYA